MFQQAKGGEVLSELAEREGATPSSDCQYA
jgi:hypothetical protein